MSEVACYSLDVPIDELFVGMSPVGLLRGQSGRCKGCLSFPV